MQNPNSINNKNRILITAALLVIVFGLVVFTFWNAQLKYNLPTPVPIGYTPVSVGDTINFQLRKLGDPTKPYFIHFFNPDCACSRFNIRHFKSLVNHYEKDVNFIIAVVSSGEVSVEDIQETFDMKIPVVIGNDLRDVMGVYSTPQAVIVGTDGLLEYRGNYNRTRYCSDPKTEYAKMAMDISLKRIAPIEFDQLALKAYGCQLPLCTNK